MGLRAQGLPSESKERSTSGSDRKARSLRRSGQSDQAFRQSGTAGGGTDWNGVGQPEVPAGSLERPVGVSASEIRPPASPVATEPPTGHSIDPALPPDHEGHAPNPVWENVVYFRHRAEEIGDLALDMIAEGLDGMSYGTARQAAHYGRIANELYAKRAKELFDQHPEALAKEPPAFFRGLAVAMPSGLLLWVLAYAACVVLW